MFVEIIGGLFTGSLALLADAGHMLTDVAGLAMALIAITLAARPATPEKTYGYYRLEILAAATNALLLAVIGAYILYEAYGRFTDPPDVKGGLVLGVATVGLLINLLSVSLLLEGQKTSLNLRGAFLEVVGDMLGSVAVIVTGIVLLVSDFKLIDPIASVVIGLFVLPRAWNLFSDAMHMLLEGAPKRIKMKEVEDHILSTPGVTGFHDVHVWSLTSGMDVISAHIVIADGASGERVLDDLCACLADHFDIEHSTFQIEQSDRKTKEHAAH
jgi:cobalt-zinc-cadmium efflux system protein